MRNRSRQRAKNRRETGSHFALPHDVMKSSGYRSLSAHAVKLLCDIGAQYNGYNNGDLSVAWSIMQRCGWKSRDTLYRAVRALRDAGMIELTRQGGMNRCSLYALSWRPIDECKGKLDVAPTRVASGAWRQGARKIANTVAVSSRHGRRVDRALGISESTRKVDRPAFRRHPVAIIDGNDRGVYGQQQAVHG